MNGFEIYQQLIKTIEPATLIDVACGRGIYAIEAAKLGFDVTATDGRTSRIPFEEFRKHNIDFKNCLVEETFFHHEVVLLSGIFYHLDFSQQHELIRKISESKCHTILLNTHVFNDSCYVDFEDLMLNEVGELGCVYKEGTNLKNRPMASMTNYFSFWWREDALKGLFAEYGFDKFELIDSINENRKFYKIEKGN